jgi:glycerophosphoryl diester phosphodiesterase
MWMAAPLYATPGAVIAHRGSGKDEATGCSPRENTGEAMRVGLANGADGNELDVQRSSDGVLVVYHNVRLPDGRFVRDLSAAELSDAYGIEKLHDVVTTMGARPGTLLNLEIKTGYDQKAESDPTITEPLVNALGEPPLAQLHVVLSSFDPETLRELAALAPHTRRALITSDVVGDHGEISLAEATALARDVGAHALHPGAEQFSVDDPESLEREIADVHGAGLALTIWGAPPERAAIFVAAGVDAVCVDHVAEAVTLIRGAARRSSALPRHTAWAIGPDALPAPARPSHRRP